MSAQDSPSCSLVIDETAVLVRKKGRKEDWERAREIRLID
jgi:hypothetical protein